MGHGDIITSTVTTVISLLRHVLGDYVRFYITRLSTVYVCGLFCSSKCRSKQVWQISSYFITFTLYNVYPQHGGGNTKHR